MVLAPDRTVCSKRRFCQNDKMCLTKSQWKVHPWDTCTQVQKEQSLYHKAVLHVPLFALSCPPLQTLMPPDHLQDHKTFRVVLDLRPLWTVIQSYNGKSDLWPALTVVTVASPPWPHDYISSPWQPACICGQLPDLVALWLWHVTFPTSFQWVTSVGKAWLK